MQEIKLQKIDSAQTVAAWDIQQRAFRPLLEKYQDYDKSPAAEDTETLRQKIERPDTDSYLFWKDEIPVGWVRVIRKGDCCKISALSVIPEYQNQGIAQKALRQIEKRYPCAKKWVLDTILQEKGNCHLYEKLGYTRTGEPYPVNEKMTLIGYEKYSPLELETERLHLRPFRSADAEDLFEILRDRQTCYDDGGYEPYLELNDDFRKLTRELSEDADRCAIELKENGKMIGLIHLMPVRERAVSCCEIGYIVHPDFRRRGYASEAAEVVIRECFQLGRFEMFVASIYQENEKSAGVLKKLRFQQEGITHKAVRHRQYGIIDMIHFYLEKDWQ